MLLPWPSRQARSERARKDAIAAIARSCAAYEDMLTRATWSGQAIPSDAASRKEGFDKLKTEAEGADGDRLEQLVEEAEGYAQQRAYFCPINEIASEAKSCLFSILDWGVPSTSLESLKNATASAMTVTSKSSADEIATARGALHVIYEEFDAWDVYMDQYNARTSSFATGLLIAIGVTISLALVLTLGWSWKLLVLVLAALAGAMASVISKLPGVAGSDTWAVNLRAYRARIATGLVGSLVGIGLLGSGVINISLPNGWTADKLLTACLSVTPPASTPECSVGGGLFIVAIAMLLGFTERLLTSLESRVIPEPKRPA